MRLAVALAAELGAWQADASAGTQPRFFGAFDAWGGRVPQLSNAGLYPRSLNVSKYSTGFIASPYERTPVRTVSVEPGFGDIKTEMRWKVTPRRKPLSPQPGTPAWSVGDQSAVDESLRNRG